MSQKLIGSIGLKFIGLRGHSGFNLYRICWFHSTSSQLYSKKIPTSDDEESSWIIQFEKENELIYGPTIGNRSNSTGNAQNTSSSTIPESKSLTPLEIINNHSEVLPVSWDPEKLINFPLINPLRSSSKSKADGKHQGNAGSMGKEEEEELNVKRNLILDKANLKVNKFPSVTKVIGETMSPASRKALELWKGRMIEKLGEEGFKEYQQKIFRRGFCLHQNIAKRLEDKSNEIEINEEISGFWKSLEPIFTHISNVKLIEKPVVHPFLCYRGIIDCVAYYNRTCYLIDWKTSSRPKPTIYNLYDEPLQVVSYLGAINFDYKYDYQVIRAAIVIAYEDGSPAHIHRLSEPLCKSYWIKWIRRLDQYWSTNLFNCPRKPPKNKL